ncbi:3-hydroxyacyl-CoA dehydrogenase [Moorella glycerini]|uniref:3-hydroxybutyryl-CoA dehydrogenase n=1 Tax=Neomoorella stamsii TaxID=1266720 RepID=A0A9X7IZZ1_9FIRM|nr:MULTISPECIES: 3-hydroxybutyryl-CoA dehydrogenase [Moorella]PRR68675.1 putative 3-hydroxybutyryl-CoA dehydrogenase [Moorella stamsii]CEP68986.1 3-hydroxyacyl-CoA dehydrogenase [Moorella glycerini]
MSSVTVVGAGTMGSGIAQVLAQAGYEVFILDTTEELVSKGFNGIKQSLNRLQQKGKLTESDVERIMGLIKPGTDLKEACSSEIVIEAIYENMDAKKRLFRELDNVCDPQTIFASNTSSLSITEMAFATSRPDRVIGMHFFNPVPIMQLVEIVKGLATSEETVAKVREVAEKLGKKPVIAGETPGFIVNRLLIPMINEAILLLGEGVATASDIDTAMTAGANHPIGPLALADLIGLDVCLAIMETLHREIGDDKYRPALLLKQMVKAGYLGRKTGKGFYKYN